ncbi:MAG TPA: hypothetical protein VEL47_06370 [Myxococcota bacterium]|nr:hypothetical protein [Myxococcota bacterium]
MPEINRLSSNGSLRINTRSNQPRTSSNRTFQEQFRAGLKSGIDLTNSAFRQVAKPIPGSAALSATISDAARSLNGGSKLDSFSSSATNPGDGDINSLQDEMVQNNQDLLEKQVHVAQITTTYNARSNIVKAMFDTLKNIGSNIR